METVSRIPLAHAKGLSDPLPYDGGRYRRPDFGSLE